MKPIKIFVALVSVLITLPIWFYLLHTLLAAACRIEGYPMTDNTSLFTHIAAELNDLKTNVRFHNEALAMVNIRKINSFLSQIKVTALGPTSGAFAKTAGVGK